MTIDTKLSGRFLEAEPAIQYHAEWVIDGLKQTYPAAFKSKTSSLSPDYLKRAAGKLYMLAEDDLELNSIYFGLNSLYEILVKKFTNLLPAPERLPALEQDAYFEEGGVPLILVERIADLALSDTSRDVGAALVALSILANIRTAELLTDVIYAPQSRCFAVKEVETLIIATSGGNVFLNVHAASAWRFLRTTLCGDVKKIRHADLLRLINKWLESNFGAGGHPALKAQLAKFSTDRILSSLSDFYSPMASAHFAQYSTELNAAALLLATTGERTGDAESRETPNFEFVKELEQEHGAYKTIKIDEEKAYLSARKRLREYQNKAREKYKDTKKARQALRLELICLANTCELSYLFRCVLIYIACVLTEGSMFKRELKVSSILTYLSTIYALYKKLAQAESPEHIEPSHFSEAISQISASSSLSVVFQFIAFLDHYSDIDVSGVERPELAAGGAVRAHYLPIPLLTESIEAFNPEQNRPKKQCIIAVMLSYYAGLRRDEVMLLKCRDIDFNTDAIYVTDEISRKTKTSVRSIPLCFLPLDFINVLKDYLDGVDSAQGDAYVLDKKSVDLAWPALRDKLRTSTGEQSFVFHSLRHAFANNTVMLLLFVSALSAKPGKLYCLQTPYFAEPQLARVSAYFEREGKLLDENFDFLSQVSRWLGHSSALVSIISYLHLFPLFTHLMQTKNPPVNLRTVVSWLYDNTYQSTQLQKLEKAPAENIAQTVFNAAIYRETKELKKHIKNVQIKETAYFSRGQLSFSEFTYQVSRLKTHPDATLTFHLADSVLSSLSALESLEVPLHLNAEFNRLVSRLDCVQALDKNINALKTLAACLRAKKTKTKKDLTLVLNAYRLLGITKGSMTLRRKPEWTELIENAGFDADLSSEEGEAGAEPKLKRSNVRLWALLPSVIDMFVLYGECVDGA